MLQRESYKFLVTASKAPSPQKVAVVVSLCTITVFISMLQLLLLSRFSRVRLCATP